MPKLKLKEEIKWARQTAEALHIRAKSTDRKGMKSDIMKLSAELANTLYRTQGLVHKDRRMELVLTVLYVAMFLYGVLRGWK